MPRLLDRAAYLRRKQELLGGLAGRVLEVGAGAGTNFDALTPGISYVGVEPSRAINRLRRRMPPGSLALRAPAEEIPLGMASVDAVFVTVVLCSVDSQEAALKEIRRVLRPGGRFVFCEHVASPAGSRRRRVQEGIAPLSMALDHGCDPSRETWTALEEACFAELHYDWYDLRKWVSGPYLAGWAVR